MARRRTAYAHVRLPCNKMLGVSALAYVKLTDEARARWIVERANVGLWRLVLQNDFACWSAHD